MGVIIIKNKYISSEDFKARIIKLKNNFYAQKKTEFSLTICKNFNGNIELNDICNVKEVSDHLATAEIYDVDYAICYLGYSLVEKSSFNMFMPLRFTEKSGYFVYDKEGDIFIYLEGLAQETSVSLEKKRVETIKFIIDNILNHKNYESYKLNGFKGLFIKTALFSCLKIVIGNSKDVYISDVNNFYKDENILFSSKTIVKYIANKVNPESVFKKEIAEERKFSPTLTDSEEKKVNFLLIKNKIYFIKKGGYSNEQYVIKNIFGDYFVTLESRKTKITSNTTQYELVNHYNVFWINELYGKSI
jgi:hypothetical protein